MVCVLIRVPSLCGRAAKTLARLRGQAGLLAPWLLAKATSTKISRGGSIFRLKLHLNPFFCVYEGSLVTACGWCTACLSRPIGWSPVQQVPKLHQRAQVIF